MMLMKKTFAVLMKTAGAGVTSSGLLRVFGVVLTGCLLLALCIMYY
jgi:hypothetical protein